MKFLTLLTLLSIASTTFASDLKITKAGASLKVAEVSTTINCNEIYDMDPGTDAEFKCELGTLTRNLQKRFGTVVKVEGLNSVSRDVLTNSVEDTRAYDVKARVYFYQ